MHAPTLMRCVAALIALLSLAAQAQDSAPPAPELVLQRGVRGRVAALAFAPDATQFAAASGHQVNLWNTSSGVVERIFTTNSVGLVALTWSPDGALLAGGGLTHESGVWRGVIYLWRTRDGQLVRTWQTGRAAITALAFSPDGQTLATAGGGDFEQRADLAEARLWDVASGRLLHTLENYGADSAALAWSGDGEKIALSYGDEFGGPDVTRVYGKNGGKPLESRGGYRPSLAFAPDEKLLDDAPGSVREAIDPEGQGPVIDSSVVRTPGGVFTLLVRSEYQADAKGESAHTYLELRRTGAKAPLAHLTLTERDLEGMTALSADGQWLLTAGYALNGKPPVPALRLWRLDEAAATWRQARAIGYDRALPMALAMSGDGGTLALGTMGYAVVLWDLKAAAPRAVLPNGTADYSMALNHDGSQLAGLLLWNVATPPQRVMTLTPRGPRAFSPDGTRLLDSDGLLDTRRGKHIVLTFPDEEGERHDVLTMESAAFAADGKLLATVDVSQDSWHELRLWDGVTGKFLRRVGFDRIVQSTREAVEFHTVAFAPRGTLLAAAGKVNTSDADRPFFALLDGATGRLVRRLTIAAPEFVEAIAFSSDGHTLAASVGKPSFSRAAPTSPNPGGAPSPSLRLWDVSSGQPRGALPVYFDTPAPFVWINNDVIATLATTGCARFWSVARQQPVADLTLLETRREPPTGPATPATLVAEWLVTTPNGDFDASPGAAPYLRWRVDGILRDTPPATARRVPGLLAQALK